MLNQSPATTPSVRKVALDTTTVVPVFPEESVVPAETSGPGALPSLLMLKFDVPQEGVLSQAAETVTWKSASPLGVRLSKTMVFFTLMVVLVLVFWHAETPPDSLSVMLPQL